MSESLFIPEKATKTAVYEAVLPQIKALISGEQNTTANLANVAAVLKEAFGFFWVGFYLTDSADELVLGPFQGPLACTRIKKGKGVCGQSWEQGKALIVDDVDAFPGHIACSSLSKSEIVVPLRNVNNDIVGVLDVDSEDYAQFDAADEKGLNELIEILKSQFA